MKHFIFRAAFLIMVLATQFYSQSAFSQVDSVNFCMKYNADSSWYDCYLIVKSGQATSIAQTAALQSQFSIVAQTGDSISIIKRYEPKTTIARVDPTNWQITSFVNHPDAQPQNDFYSITHPLSPSSFYPPGIKAGDTVKLFSIKLIDTLLTQCGKDIRIFENLKDPPSSAPGMGGGNYSNGFTMGSITQLYGSNDPPMGAKQPVIVSVIPSCSNGIAIDLTANAASGQGPLTYIWRGPAAFVSTNEDVNIPNANASNSGEYNIIIADSLACKDTATVLAIAKPFAGNDFSMCPGTAMLTGSPITYPGPPIISGVWSALPSNPAGATLFLVSTGVINVSVVNNTNTPLVYKFVYTLGSCSDTVQITVFPKPTITMAENSMCINELPFPNLTPSSGGSWVSSNPAVAAVTNTGIVIPVSPGVATFSFTQTSTGCLNTTLPFTVHPQPSVSFTGPTAVCIGGTIQLNPSSGGTWTSNNNAVATVTNSGLVSGITSGTVTLTFTEALTGCTNSLVTDVIPKPVVAITGHNQICIGSTTTLFPTNGGSWASSNPFVCSVTNTGIVTGIAPGTATFIFTSSTTGCSSISTLPVTVNPNPTVNISFTEVCIGAIIHLSPNNGGTWVSSNPSVATVTSATGVATAVGAGMANFTFTNSTTLCSATTGKLTVNPPPAVTSSKDSICIGATANILPSLTPGASWTNTTPDIVSLGGTPPSRVITGLASGIAKLIYTSPDGCKSDTLRVKVLPRPEVTITGGNQICIGETTTLSPTSGGTWISTSPLVGSVTNAGLVTGISPGTATFNFTSQINGCISNPTNPVTVLATPFVSITGPTSICIGGTSFLSSSSSGGTWQSSNPAVATVNASGLVTGISAGVATFIFTSNVMSCVSKPTEAITVIAKPVVSLIGPGELCVGQNTFVIPNTGGSWTSINPSIATISNSGVITANSPGTASFTFTQTGSMCASDPIQINVITLPSSISANQVFVGDTAQLTPNTKGWVSSDPSIATVDSTGKITTLSPGDVTFTYSDNASSCFAFQNLKVFNKKTILKVFTFSDNNNNGSFDPGFDSVLPNVAVSVLNTNDIYLTNAMGMASLDVPGGNVNVQALVPYGQWTMNPKVLNLTLVNNMEEAFFPFVPLIMPNKVEVNIASPIFRCNSKINFNVSAMNLGSNPVSGKMVFTIDGACNFTGATPAPTVQTSNKMTWNISALSAGQMYKAIAEVKIPTVALQGDSLRFLVQFIDEENKVLSTFYYADKIRCSYDPNDKQNWPNREGEENYTLREEQLRYTIRFQNTGNDTAFYVKLEDVLDKGLDRNSLIVADASHETRTRICNGDTLCFIFDDILLTDSTTNSRESEGFVTFYIDHLSTIPNGTIIKNSAAIFFDQNPAVLTNTVQNTILDKLPCPGNELLEENGKLIATGIGNLYSWYECGTDSLIFIGVSNIFFPGKTGNYYVVIERDECNVKSECVGVVVNGTNNTLYDDIVFYPNPGKDEVYIKTPISIHSIELYDVNGRLIYSKEKELNSISLTGLVTGIYLVRINRAYYGRVVKN